jgi:hypothetical protein
LRRRPDCGKEEEMTYTMENGLLVEGSLEPDPELVKTMRERESSPAEPVKWEHLRQNLGL